MDHIRRDRAGVSSFIEQRADADPGRLTQRIYRVGHLVRELRSPDYNPIDAALGRSRSAAGLADLRNRSQRDRIDRYHFADRNREEERYTNDRFRAGRRAQPGQVIRGRDLPGLCSAFPADHDDYNGGAAGRLAVGPRYWLRLRIAAAAWRRDCGRTDSKPDADAVHDPGHLFVSGCSAAMGAPSLQA